MAAFFERQLLGSGNTATKDDWYDIGALSSPAQDSPIPSGKTIWLGFSYLYSPDKAMEFELRTNNSGVSTGTLINTALLARGASDPGAGSNAIDSFQNGFINIKSTLSTGVEKVWLRVTSGNNIVASFTWQIFYTYDE